jgi:hypothetical protein
MQVVQLRGHVPTSNFIETIEIITFCGSVILTAMVDLLWEINAWI